MSQFNDLKNFYSKLQDDESRYIFNQRLLYSLDDNDEHLWEMVDKLFEKKYFSQEIAQLKKLKISGTKIILYGAGFVGKTCKRYFEKFGLIADFFCDKSTDKQRTGYMGMSVISPQTLAEIHKNSVVVITASKIYAIEIKAGLKELGFNGKLFDSFINYEVVSYFKHSFLKPLKNEIYIDCGVLDGSTIKEFIEFTGGGG